MQAERLRLDMTLQIQQFYKWIINNSLTAKEISLWHALLHIADDAGYPVWLSVGVSRLEKLTGMKKDAIYKARDGLENKARIEIKSGKGNQAANYRIIPFTEGDYEVIEPIEDIEKKPSIEHSQVQEEEIDIFTEQPPVDLGTSISIFRRIQDIIPMPPSMDIHHIRKFMEEGMEERLLCEAIDITKENEELKQKNPTDRWNYFKGIIRTWHNNGIKTYEGYKEHEKKREEQMSKFKNKQAKPKRTRFHNFEGRTEKYTAEQLEDVAERKRREYLERLKKQN